MQGLVFCFSSSSYEANKEVTNLPSGLSAAVQSRQQNNVSFY